MTEKLDTTEGWCCDGRTWGEHAHGSADGECCQPKNTQIGDLPPEGQRAARERMSQAES
jgi:hypothetical protein